MTINAGNPSGYYPGGPTYIQDTYLAGTFNLSVGSSPQDLTFRTQCTFLETPLLLQLLLDLIFVRLDISH